MHRVLIIGCGRIAGGFDEDRAEGAPALTHAGAYRAHGEFVIAGCVDPDPVRRAAFARHWSVAHEADAVSLLPPDEYDVVSICSPTSAHASDVESALGLGAKLVFCEKPVSGNARDTAALVRRCAQSGVHLAVNYTRRWAPDVVELARQLAAGDWGEVRSVAGIYTKGALHNGGHMIDLLNLLLGPVIFEAAGEAVYDFWDDDPSVPALLRSEAGVPIALSVGHARDFAQFELVLIAERGEVAMRDGGLSWTIRRAGDSAAFQGYRALGAFEHRPGRYDEAMQAAAANIVATLKHGAPLASTGETALAAQRICEQMRDAALLRTH